MEFTKEVEASLTLYCIATQHGREQAVSRLVEIGTHELGASAHGSTERQRAEIGLRVWSEHPHYMPERMCGAAHLRRNLHPLRVDAIR